MALTIATTIDEILAGLAGGARPIAGGTDLVVGSRQGKFPLPEDLIAIDRVTELAGIEEGSTEIRIGSGVTHAQLMAPGVVVDQLTGIADAAALVGSPATRNVGTIGGNVMNGSPAMDTGAPLLVLGAQAELRTAADTRLVALDDLWVGPGKTSASPEELCTALVVPKPVASSGSAYVRLEYRRSMEIAIVGAAAAVTLDGDVISSISVALAAVAPTILPVVGLDQFVGQSPTEVTLGAIAEAASDQCTPISDLRASERYRRKMIGVMAQRAVDAAAKRAAGVAIAVPVNRTIGIGAQS